MEPGPTAPPDVTVVVVTWQQRELVLACLDSLAHQTVACRVLVVDNGSDDGTGPAIARAHPGVAVLRLEDNRGFAGGVAAALPLVQTRFLALLNNDAVADPGWLEASLTTFADRALGETDDDAVSRPAEVFGFSGGAAVLRTLAVQAVGGIPASFFMYYEDTDLSWRLRLAGWRIVYEPSAVVRHRHAASSDVRSEMFAFHNERNRLLTLVRNAPWRVVARGSGRFLLTTASLAAKRAIGRRLPPDPVFQPGLRLRVLGATVAALPGATRARSATVRRRARADVWTTWAGVPARETGPPQPARKG
jgi:GT2 family glycosyltransferase